MTCNVSSGTFLNPTTVCQGTKFDVFFYFSARLPVGLWRVLCFCNALVSFLCLCTNRITITHIVKAPPTKIRIRYDSVNLTCNKKLTGSQLSLPHGISKKLKCETITIK